MSKQAWNIFIGFLALLSIGFLGFNAWQYRQQLDKAKADLETERARVSESQNAGESSAAKLNNDIATLQQNLKQTQEIAVRLGAEKTTLQTTKAALEAANNRLSAENSRLQSEVQQATALKSRLESDLKSELASKDVKISQLEGKLSVDILNKVLFDLGKAELKDEGKNILQDVATALENYPNRPIHVIGHTDNIPFKGGGGRFRSNWELSAGRAVAAVQFLQNIAGIDPARLAAVGHSEYHPIAKNETDGGRAQNRRITLVIMPEELRVKEPPTPEPTPEPEPEPTPEPAPEPAKAAAAPTGITPPTGAVITNSVAAKGGQSSKPITVNTNFTLPPRATQTNSAPKLPTIPAPKARPESATPPKG